ncbi:Transmembrane protein 242-like protein, partial [Dinothrombium tinctorium]
VFFLSSVAGISTLFGFGLTVAVAKKKDPQYFAKGLQMASKNIPESGGALAMRALGYGSLYAVTGFSVFCFVVWKAMGVKDLAEFRQKVGSFLPRIPKKEHQGKSDFKSLRELITYISEESKKSDNK